MSQLSATWTFQHPYHTPFLEKYAATNCASHGTRHMKEVQYAEQKSVVEDGWIASTQCKLKGGLASGIMWQVQNKVGGK